MLIELTIKNFAIIDDLHIRFSNGLTILSGETGAGKSIIINAVNLLLGSRATSKLIRTGADSAKLEAMFEISPKSRTAEAMRQRGYEPSEGLLIKRIISRKERHRIYINGGPSTIQILTDITENLASISGQHAHQRLLREDEHLLIVDQTGSLVPLRNSVFKAFYELMPLIKELKELRRLQEKQAEHVELLGFQKKEIEEAAITPEEDITLEQERIRLKNSEALFASIQESIDTLYSSHGAVTEQLTEIKKRLETAATLDSSLASSVEAVTGTAFMVEDITENLRKYLNTIQMDDRRLEEVEERLDTINKLKRKYGTSLSDIFARLETVDKELSKIENLDSRISKLEKNLSKDHKNLAKMADNLSKQRKQAAKKLSKNIEKELSSLKMTGTKIKVSFSTLPADSNTDIYLTANENTISETGIDRVEFLIAPNIGEALKPLPDIASGGELSRVVLAIKSIMAETESVETVVFDEVDAGIGGGAAEVVGKKLSSLSNHHQIICITHLPQIAKFGNSHFRISKRVDNGRTRTDIEPLENDERVNELARMLGGEKITRKTLEHAREMLIDL